MTQILGVIVLFSFLLRSSKTDLVTPNPDSYTFTFEQSISGFTVWTCPATRRIRNNDTLIPTATGSTLSISSAKEELESFQVIIAPTSTFTSMTVSISNFTTLGPGTTIDVGAANFASVSPWGQGTFTVVDTTTPVPEGGSVPLSSTLPTVLWMTLYVPGPGTTAGTTTTNLILVVGGNTVTIPISLYVFNFFLAQTPHFDTFLMSQPTITVYQLDQLDAWKKVYLQHRMSYTDPAWPDGFNYEVGWDCSTHTLIDADPATSTDQCIWANGCLVRRYVQGKGSTWDGTTYPDWIDHGFSTYTAVSTDGGRPDPFCDVACNDPNGWMCSLAYEQEWGKYLLALQNYMVAQNISVPPGSPTKGFWYTQNEPQNWNDYTISAYLCSIARKYAPQLRIMLSREAQPWIAERPDFNYCSYDIWMAWVWRYTQAYTQIRQLLFGETSWYYSLDTDNNCAYPGVCGPAFCPAISITGNNGAENPVATNDGPHYRVIPWVAWTNRITGWGYYHDDIFWDIKPPPGPNRPRISAALLREGFEDYEYLYLANGNSHPMVGVKEVADNTAMSIGFAVGVWEHDPTAIHALRHELGLKIEGSRSDFPYLVLSPTRPFGSYYIDFQDTRNNPNNTVFTFDSNSWIPIGWDPYSISKGFGWNSMYLGVPNTIQTGNLILHCTNISAGNILQTTVCYDDYNHPDEFHFALVPGMYNVTVAVGMQGQCREDTEFVSINNIVLRNFSCNPCCEDSREYSGVIPVLPGPSGGEIVMILGNDLGYTILNYMKIEELSSEIPSISTLRNMLFNNPSEAISYEVSVVMCFLNSYVLMKMNNL